MSYAENYNINPVAGFEGMVADMSNATIVSKTAEAAVGFGKAVSRGTGSNSVRVTGAGDTKILGIAVRSQSTDPSSTSEYPVNDTVAVMRKGPIWVKAGGVVAEGQDVYFVTSLGNFSAIPGTGKVQVVGATFETSGSVDDLVRIHII